MEKFKNPVILFVFIFIVYGLTNISFYKKVPLFGDQAHYLVVAKTLWERHTLDLKESYTDRRFYRDIHKGWLSPHTSASSQNGKWYFKHQYGFPVILIPVVILGNSLGNYMLPAYFLMSLLICISSVFFFALLIEYYRLEKVKAVWIVLGVYLSLPVLFFSKSVRAEVPVFLFVCILLWYLFVPVKRRVNSWIHMSVISLLIGAMPWIHPKFSVLAGGFLLAFLIKEIDRNKKIMISGVFAGSVLLCLVFVKTLYGSFNFSAQFGPKNLLSSEYLLNGTLGFLVDQHAGLLFMSPVYWLIIPGLMTIIKFKNELTADRRDFLVHLVLAGAASGYYLLSASPAYEGIPVWTGSVAGRYILPILPIILIFMVAFVKQYKGRGMLVFLSSLSILIGLLVVNLHPQIFSRRPGTYEEGNPLLLVFSSYDLDLRKFFPNLLSMEHGMINIALAVIVLIFMVYISYVAVNKKRWIYYAPALLMFMAYAGIALNNHTYNKEPISYSIPAVAEKHSKYPFVPEFYSWCGKRNSYSKTIGSLRNAHDCVLAEGPYKFFLKGRYRATFVLDYLPAVRDDEYKSITVNAMTAGMWSRETVVYNSRKIDVRTLKRGENRILLDFYNERPSHPLETRLIIGERPVHSLIFKGVEITYVGKGV